MKKLIVTVMGVVLAGSAVTAMASKSDREQLGQCTANIEAVFGDDARTKLKGIKRGRSGNTLKIQTIPAGAEGQVVKCWVDKEGQVTLLDSEGVAITAPTYNSADKVSLND
jgi:hypothetical protein